MKKIKPNESPDELRPEYDLSKLKGGVRGKYYKQAVAGTNLVLMEKLEHLSPEHLAEVEDFIDFLGFNPLSASITVRLKAEYANSDSLAWIEKDLLETNLVKEVIYG